MERAATNEEIELAESTIQKYKHELYIQLAVYLIAAVVVPLFTIGFDAKRTVHESLIIHLFFSLLMFIGFMAYLYISSSKQRFTIKHLSHFTQNKILNLLIVTASEYVMLNYDRKKYCACVFQLPENKLLVLNASYSDGDKFPTNNFEVQFFKTQDGKDMIFSIIPNGVELEEPEPIHGKLKDSLNLEKQFTAPYEFSIFDGNINNTANFIK